MTTETIILLKALSRALSQVADEMEEAEPKKSATATISKRTRKKETESVPESTSAGEETVEKTEGKGESVTLEQIRAVLQEKRAEGKKDKFKALFAQFGVQRLPDVNPDQYAALLAAAEAL